MNRPQVGDIVSATNGPWDLVVYVYRFLCVGKLSATDRA